MTTATAQTTDVTNVKPLNKINYNQLIDVDGNKVFPDFFTAGEVSFKIRKNRHPDCLPSNPMYIPCEQTLRRALAWWFAPMRQPLGLHGETGTGKTELLLYLADHLNEPVYIVKVHSALMPEDVEGSKELVNSDKGVITKNSLGLAAKAYRNGGLLVLDELDKANPAFGCSLHNLVEGKPWPIEQFGIVVNKHSLCRITATANTMGEGGHERYHTSNRMDQALRSRFGWLATDFPDRAHEFAILEKTFPMLPKPMIKDCVILANMFRDALLGPNRDGNIDEPINAVFSTRTLVNWCHYTITFGQKAKWMESLKFAFWGSLDPECESQALDIIQRQLGDLTNKTVKEVLGEFLPKKP